MSEDSEPYPPLEDVWLTPDGCLDAAWAMLNTLTCNPDTRLYFYVALECRLAIERLLRDILIVISPRRLTRRQWGLYRAADLYKEIRRLRPDFDKRWLFVKELYRGRRPQLKLPEVELKALTRVYGKLGGFLHSPSTPFSVIESQDWKDRIEAFIGDTYAYLEPIREAYREGLMPAHPVFDESLEWAFRQFCRGRMDAPAVRQLGRRLTSLA